jgi:hypothetical protein
MERKGTGRFGKTIQGGNLVATGDMKMFSVRAVTETTVF